MTHFFTWPNQSIVHRRGLESKYRVSGLFHHIQDLCSSWCKISSNGEWPWTNFLWARAFQFLVLVSPVPLVPISPGPPVPTIRACFQGDQQMPNQHKYDLPRHSESLNYHLVKWAFMSDHCNLPHHLTLTKESLLLIGQFGQISVKNILLETDFREKTFCWKQISVKNILLETTTC